MAVGEPEAYCGWRVEVFGLFGDGEGEEDGVGLSGQ
jgi:hypothetical protein